MAETKVTVTLEGVDKTAKAISGAMNRLNDFGNKMKSVGDTMTQRVTLPIVGAGAAILKVAGDFEASMNKVRALTGATGSSFDALSEQAKELGRTTRFTASEAADAMGFLGMAGFSTEEILASMGDTLNLAAAANLDLASSADIVSNIMSGYGIETEDLTGAVDVLTKAFTSANTDLSQLGDGMKFVAPVASDLNLKFSETTAALGMLSDAGIQGGQAGTSLRRILLRLVKPTGAAGEILDRVGISAYDAEGNFKSLADILVQFEKAGLSAAEMTEIFGIQGISPMNALIERGSEDLQEFTGLLDDSVGTSTRIASIQMEGLNGSMLEMKSALEGLMIAFADAGFIDAFTNLVKQTTGLLQGLTKLDPALFKTIGIIAGIAAAVGPGLSILGRLIGMFATFGKVLAFLDTSVLPMIVKGGSMLIPVIMGITAPVWIAIAAITALIAIGYLLWKNWDAIAGFMSELGQSIVNSFNTFVTGATNFITSLWNTINFIFSWEGIGTILGFWIGLQIRLGIAIFDFFTKTLPQAFIQFGGMIREQLGKVSESIYRFFAVTIPQAGERFMSWLSGIPDRSGQAIGSLWSRTQAGFNNFTKNAWDWSKRTADGIVSWIIGIPSRISGAIRKAVTSFTSGFSSGLRSAGIPGFAGGVRNFSGGLAMVGERGPELVRLPRGSDVLTAGETRRQTGTGGQTIVNQTNNVYNQLDLEAVSRDLAFRINTA